MIFYFILITFLTELFLYARQMHALFTQKSFSLNTHSKIHALKKRATLSLLKYGLLNLFFLFSAIFMHLQKWNLILEHHIFLLWIIFTLSAFFYVLLYPFIVAKLRYQLQSLQSPNLEKKFSHYLPYVKTKVIYGTSKKNHANATALSFFNIHRILLSEWLLNHYDQNDIQMIVAHEMGHCFYHHLTKYVSIIAMLGSTIIVLGRNDIVTVLLLLPVWLFWIKPILNTIRRSFEKSADQFAISCVGFHDFKKTLKKLYGNTVEIKTDRYYSFWYDSHPNWLDRISQG